MRQSNGYVIGFIVAMTVLCAGALAGVNELLAERISTQESLDTKKKILSTVIDREEVLSKNDKEIEADYAKYIAGIVINAKGEEITDVIANNIVPRDEFKKKNVLKKQLPVFIYVDASGKKTYILPLYGLGLWDEVWGYIAVDSDGKTIKGIVLDHKAETPGLGARITEIDVQSRFIGKSIFDEKGNIAIHFMKGEGHSDLDEYSVDGLSGSSMTTNGVNTMLESYMGYYKAYLKNL